MGRVAQLQQPSKANGKAGLGGTVQSDDIQLLVSRQDAESSWLECQVHVGRMDRTHAEEGWDS